MSTENRVNIEIKKNIRSRLLAETTILLLLNQIALCFIHLYRNCVANVRKRTAVVEALALGTFGRWNANYCVESIAHIYIHIHRHVDRTNRAH